ncbi:MAG: hypothetical protein WCJ51_04865, partial [Candidatus Moraniibacteriota bacterium]
FFLFGKTVDEVQKMIDEKTALTRVEADKLDQLLHPTLDPKEKSKFKVIANGLPASPGAAYGQVVFNAETAVEWVESGKKVISSNNYLRKSKDKNVE